MQSGYVRNLSGMENLYRVFERDHAFYIQWVIDFESLPNDLDWQAVIDKSLETNPGISVKLSSTVFSKKWRAVKETVAFCEATFEGSLYEALLDMPASLSEEGPASEVRRIVYTGGVALVFRSLHSVVDATGSWGWLSDCIRIVNGLSPVGHEAAINDKELSCRLRAGFWNSGIASGKYTPLTSGHTSGPKPFYLFTVPGSSRGMSKVLCHLLKRYADAKSIDELRFLIPSDLRKYDSSVRSTGNLTGILDIAYTRGTSDEEIDRTIRERIKTMDDASYVKRVYFWKFVAVGLWKSLLASSVRNNQYPATGLISNIGDLDTDVVTVKGICPRNVLCLAPYSGFHPLFIVSSSFNNQLTINLSIPEHLQGDAGDLIAFVKEGLRSRAGADRP